MKQPTANAATLGLAISLTFANTALAELPENLPQTPVSNAVLSINNGPKGGVAIATVPVTTLPDCYRLAALHARAGYYAETVASCLDQSGAVIGAYKCNQDGCGETYAPYRANAPIHP